MFKLIKRKNIVPLDESTFEDQILIYEARDFLRSLVTENTHRIQRWYTILEYGTVLFEFRNNIYFELSTLIDSKVIIFSYDPYHDVEYVKMIIQLKDGQVTKNHYFDDKPLSEIKDLMKLSWYIDHINTKNTVLFNERKSEYNDLIDKMDWDYVFDYSNFSEQSLLRLSRKDNLI